MEMAPIIPHLRAGGAAAQHDGRLVGASAPGKSRWAHISPMQMAMHTRWAVHLSSLFPDWPGTYRLA